MQNNTSIFYLRDRSFLMPGTGARSDQPSSGNPPMTEYDRESSCCCKARVAFWVNSAWSLLLSSNIFLAATCCHATSIQEQMTKGQTAAAKNDHALHKGRQVADTHELYHSHNSTTIFVSSHVHAPSLAPAVCYNGVKTCSIHSKTKG